jgi:hypothetical protein
MASWTERDGKYCTRRKMQKGRLIFVLEVADEAAFAFEAKSAIAAEALVHEPWFFGAVTDFLAKRHKAWNGNVSLCTRAATNAEATLYRDRAAEFAEAMDNFLIAHLAEP